MIERDKAIEIRRLFYVEHWKIGTISTQLLVHPDVVKRVIGPVGRPGKDNEPRASILDPYKPFISDILKSYPRLRSTRIYDMLCERGYCGSVRSVRRYVSLVRPLGNSSSPRSHR